jgi:hypothetical protein
VDLEVLGHPAILEDPAVLGRLENLVHPEIPEVLGILYLLGILEDPEPLEDLEFLGILECLVVPAVLGNPEVRIL